MNKLYSINHWENYPSEKSPLNKDNLMHIEKGIDDLDNRVIKMNTEKANSDDINTLVKNWSIDEKTGVITVEKFNGEKVLFDLNIEKIPVDFELSKDGILTMTTDDGGKFTANIGAMIPVLTFDYSDTITVSVNGTGVNKTYSFSIKAGSVTEDKLQPNFLADVKTEVAKAQASQTAAADSASVASVIATLAESYTHGGTGTREGEETDNAKYYMEQAKEIVGADFVTHSEVGQPNGVAGLDESGKVPTEQLPEDIGGGIPTNEKGQPNGVATLGENGKVPTEQLPQVVTVDSEMSKESENPLQNKVITEQIEALTKAIEDATALRASLEAYGMVKLTDSSAVTDSTGLALPATEKNASIAGTLANQISQLNTDFENHTIVKNLYKGEQYALTFNARRGSIIYVSRKGYVKFGCIIEQDGFVDLMYGEIPSELTVTYDKTTKILTISSTLTQGILVRFDY